MKMTTNPNKTIRNLIVFKCVLISTIFWLTSMRSNAQVGISSVPITPHSSSVLELRSTSQGFLLPRMTTAERDAIVSPATGLVIYNTTTNQINFYVGSSWQAPGAGSLTSLNGLTGSAQSFVNGANVTITSTGTTHTLGWEGQLSIPNGGTGLSTIGTSNSLLFTPFTDSIGSIPTANNGVLTTDNSGVPSISSTLPAAVQDNITTLGTITTGTWNGTTIDDNKIAATLTGKTYNGLTLGSQATGFTIAGGSTSKTLTVPLDATVSGINTGDQLAVSGNAGSATLTGITDDNATAATMYPTWVTTASGNQAQKVSSTKLSFNPSTGTLTSIAFAGNLTGNVTGNATTVTTNANLTGEVTSVGNVTTIAANAVTTAKILNSNITYPKIQNISATNMVLGRVSAGAGTIEEIPTSGSGNVVRTTSPVLVTPTLGVASATTINKLTITAPATGSTVTIADGKTLSVPLDATVSGINTGDQATVSGNAGSATLTGITDDNATAATMYPTWVTTASGNQAQKVSSTKLSFNPSTGTLTSTAFAGNLTGNVTGNLTGNASTVTTNANLTGDVTSIGNATTIAANAVTTAKILNSNITYQKIQNISATNMVLGRATAGAGVVEEIPTTGSGNVVRATSPILITPVLGVATGTSLALGGGTALTTTNQTGTGNIVLANTPTLTTPVLGVASATTINKLTITAPATGSTLAIADGKTLSVPLDATVSGINTGDQLVITGNAGSATLTAITDDNATAATMYPTWVTTASGNQAQKVSSTKLSFNPSTGTLTSTAFAGNLTGNVTGNLTGNASTVTTNANLTGDVTSIGNATTIAANAVTTPKITDANITYAKIQNISASNVVLGRVTAGAGTVEEIPTTGSGNVVRATSPTLITPVLGVATGTSLALGGGAALTTTNQTGTGNIVLANTPTLTTPVLGIASATTINKLTITAPATGSTLTIADGKTLSVPLDATVSGINTGDQATISGNAGSATLTGITDDNATAATMYPTWVTTASGNQAQKVSSTKLSFNPSTGTLTSTAFVGNLTGNVTGNVSGSSSFTTGNAATVTTNANLTGDVTSVGNATTIAANAVTTAKILNANITYAKIQNVSASNMVLGRATAGAGTIEEIPTTGSGNVVRATSPVLITPTLGVASATSFNKIVITAPATGATVTIADGKTLNVPLDATVSGTNTGDQLTISGNAGSATLTAVSDDNATSATMYPTWVTSNSGNQAQKVSSTKLTFNPATGILTSTGFAGNLTGNVTGNVSGSSSFTTGNAATVTTNANLTGDVTSVGNATTISANAITTAKIPDGNITYSKIQNVSASNVVLGRVTAGAGIVEEIQTTGSGNVVRATTPTLVTPILGAATGTSLALGGGSALTTTNQTGTGNIVLANTPTLTTPVLGVAAATTINKVAITAPATGATLTIANAKTLNVPLDATVSGTNTGDQTTISGNAGSATLTAITDDNATAATMYPTWSTSSSGNQAQKVSSTKMTFNPSTGTLTSTAFAGNLTGNVSGNLTGNVTGNVSGSSSFTTGNAATVTTNANLTGDVTSVGNATTIADDAIITSKILDGAVTMAKIDFSGVPMTGSGSFVLATSPALITPILGVATATSLSINGGTALTTSNQTGTGNIVLANTPTLVTPILGSASATTINKVSITAPATSATLTIANLKTLNVPLDATVSGTNTGDQTTVSGNAGSATLTAITDDNVSAGTMYPGWVTAASGNQAQKVSSTKMSFTPSTGTLSTTALRLGGGTALATTNQTGTGSLVLAASPTLTGTPTLPSGTIATTQTAGNNSTAIATTAFVNSAVPNFSYRTILQASGSHIAGKVAGTYLMGNGDPIAIAGTGTLYPIATIYIAAADYPTVNGVAAELRIRAQLYVNNALPTGNFTFGLYPITRPGSSGGTGLNIYTVGTVVTGSTGATFSAPAADAMLSAVSGDFALPADGHYVIGIVTNSTVATNSLVHVTASLQMHNQ